MTYRTPGVYVDEVPATLRPAAPVATDVPVFIGCTEDAALKNVPTRIAALSEFEAKFGRPPVTEFDLRVIKRTGETGALLGIDVALHDGRSHDAVPPELMSYSLQHYFANGGGPCWIYSLGAYGSASKADYIEAIKALEAVDEPTLLVFPGATQLSRGEHEEVVATALESCLKRKHRFTITDVADAVPGGANETAVDVTDTFRANLAPTSPQALQYGAAYWPYLRTRIPWFTRDDQVRIKSYTETRVANDGTTQHVASPLKRAVDRQAVALSSAAIRSAETAVYNAALNHVGSLFVTLPPSPAVAGVYVRTDRDRGVWKAPANSEVLLVSAPALHATHDTNEALNVDLVAGKSVNAIRHFAGRGVLVWGARTLAGNNNEFRYVPVRRLVTMIEVSVAKAIAKYAFESNDPGTWTTVRATVESFLMSLWRVGALQGMKPEEAFGVHVGPGVTMTAQDIADGRLILRVMVAPLRPAEFIVLRFEQAMPKP